jgi:hypothetical protein
MFNQKEIDKRVSKILKGVFGYNDDQAKRFVNDHDIKMKEVMQIALNEYIARQSVFCD